jgi:putative transposase
MVQSRSRTALRTVLRIACDLLRLVSAAGRSHAQLAAENLFVKKQLALYVERQVKSRRADDATRIALVALSGLIDWRRLLTVVKPDTLIRWHRKGFQLFWHWNSRPRGRPRMPADLQRLIAEMAAANRTWGQERIASELLLKLGIRVSPRTVRRYSPRVSRLGAARGRRRGAHLCGITPARCWRAISLWRSLRRCACSTSSWFWRWAPPDPALECDRSSDG